MDARKTRKRLALAISAALLVPGMAFAGDAKEKELEARIAQLEAQVQALLAAQQQQQATITQTQTQLDEVRVAQAAPADGKPKIQSSPILVAGNPDGRFSFGGFIKLDAMYTDTSDGEIADGSAGRMFYLPSAIPVGGADESHVDTDTHAQFSRFWFAADGDVHGHKTRGYLEFDLFGGGSSQLGNEAATNTHAVTLRQAFSEGDRALAWCSWCSVVHGHDSTQSLIDPVLDRSPDHRQRQLHAFGEVHCRIKNRGLILQLDVPAAGHGLPAPPQLGVLLLVQNRMAPLAFGQAENFTP